MIFGFNENLGKEDMSVLFNAELLWSNPTWIGDVSFTDNGPIWLPYGTHLLDYERLYLKYKWYYEGSGAPEVGYVRLASDFNYVTPIVSQNITSTGFVFNKRGFYIPSDGAGDNKFFITNNTKGVLRNGAWTWQNDNKQVIPIALYGYKKNVVDDDDDQWSFGNG